MSLQTVKNSRAVGIKIRPLGPRIGAEIHDVHLSGDLAPDVVDAIKAALLQHKVIFFRDQTHLNDDEHQRFSALLGDLVRHPVTQSKNAINLVDGGYSWARANNWHSDVTFKLAPIRATVLRAVTLPRLGGDTMFANTVAAYAMMPSVLRQLADSLWGVHSNMGEFAPYRLDSDSEENQRFAKLYQAKKYVTEHPLVRVVAETSERSIVLGGHFRHFLGVSRSDSRHLFDLFQSYVAAPENIVRWQWRSGDVGIWENRTTQHYAVDDYGEEPRVMHSVTIMGDVPVGVDGRSSIARCAPPLAN